MPGVYLAAILVSAAGIAVLDWRLRLALWRAPGATAAAVLISVAFFLAWDAVGIATGVFFKGDSALFVGIDVAPQIPLEEVFFLAFLSYLTMVCWTGALRVFDRTARRRVGR